MRDLSSQAEMCSWQFCFKREKVFLWNLWSRFFNVWLRIFFAFYFHHQKYLTLCKMYNKNLELCMHWIIRSFIRWKWWGFHEVDWKMYLSADWTLELPEGVFLLGPRGDFSLEVILVCLWVFMLQGWDQFTACSHLCQDLQCWACWSTRMGSYVLIALSCSGMLVFLSCESLWTHWCWSGVLGLHRSVLRSLSIPSVPVSRAHQWLLWPEWSRNSVIQEPQKVG